MTLSRATRDKARDAAERVLAVCDVIADIVDSGELVFLDDIRAQWAAEMGRIRIGETVNKIPDSVREQLPAQPWRQIIDMRNLAARQYDDLEPRRVWRTLVRDVPALDAYLRNTMLPQLEA